MTDDSTAAKQDELREEEEGLGTDKEVRKEQED